MSSVPSFLYSGLDDDTIKLSKQLASLGGGDAKTEYFRVLGVFSNSPVSNTGSTRVLLNFDQSIAIRDIYQPASSPASDCLTFYPVSSTHLLENMVDFKQSNDSSGLGYTRELSVEHEIKRVVNDVLDGFNHCIITYGERGSGKTLALFGEDSLSSESTSNLRVTGMIDRILDYVYRSIRHLNDSHVVVAVSAWIIKGQQIIDLLTPVKQGEVAMEFVSVECPTVDVAKEVIYQARNRAPGAKVQGQGPSNKSTNNVKESDRAHFFMRILLHHSYPTKTIVSALYIADLLGIATDDMEAEAQRIQSTPATQILAQKQARRDIFLQLSTLSKVLSEMKSANNSSTTHAQYSTTPLDTNHPKLIRTSARESKLTSLLGPIITGNCLTTMLVFLIPGEAHYRQSKSTLSTIDGMTEVLCPVYRVTGVPLSALKLVSHEEVLPAYGMYLPASKISRIDHAINKVTFDDSSNQDYADMDLVKLASPDMILHTPKKSSKQFQQSSLNEQSIDPFPSNQMPSLSRIEDIMGEFHNLMAKVDLSASSNIESQPSNTASTKYAVKSVSPPKSPNKNAFDLNRDYLAVFQESNVSPSDLLEETCLSYASSSDDDNDSVDSLSDSSQSPKQKKTLPNKSNIPVLANKIRSSREAPSNLQDTSMSSGIGAGLPPRSLPLSAYSNTHENLLNSTQSLQKLPKEPLRKSIDDSGVSNNSAGHVRLEGYESSHQNGDYLDRDKSVHSALLQSLNHERALKDKLQKRIDSFEEELLELKTQHDVQIATYQVESRRLQQQLRVVCGNNSLTDVFSTFEEDVSRLSKENKELRDQNLRLETKLLDLVFSKVNPTETRDTNKGKVISSARSSMDGESILSDNDLANGEVVRAMDATIKSKLREKIRKLIAEKEELRHECEELRKRDRQQLLNQKLNDELSRRLKQSFIDLERTRAELAQVRQLHSESARNLDILKGELGDMQISERNLREERSRNLQEVSQLRERIKEVDAESRRLAQLNKFVSKHASGPPIMPVTKSMPSARPINSHENILSTNQNITDEPNTTQPNTTYIKPSYLMRDSSSRGDRFISPANGSKLKRESSNWSHLTPSTIGLAGLSDAEYYRLEEANDTLHPELEASLSAMHESLVTHSPQLLPLFRKMRENLLADRARGIVEKSRLVGKVASAIRKNNQMNSTIEKVDENKGPEPKLSRQNASISLKESSINTARKIDFNSLKKRARI